MADEPAALTVAKVKPWIDPFPELDIPSDFSHTAHTNGRIQNQTSISPFFLWYQRPVTATDPRWASPQAENCAVLGRTLHKVLLHKPFDPRFLQRILLLSTDPLFAHDALGLLALITIQKSTIHEPESAGLREDVLQLAGKILRGITHDNERIAVIDRALQFMYFKLSDLHRRKLPIGSTADEYVSSELEHLYIWVFQRSLENMRYPKPDGTFFYDRREQADALLTEINGRMTYGIVSSYPLPSGFSIRNYQFARINAVRATLIGLAPPLADALAAEMNVDDPEGTTRLAIPNPDQHAEWMKERHIYNPPVIPGSVIYEKSFPRRLAHNFKDGIHIGAAVGREIGWKMGPFALLPFSMTMGAAAGFVIGSAINGIQIDQIANECFSGASAGILLLPLEDGISRDGAKYYGLGSFGGKVVGAALGFFAIPSYRFAEPGLEKTVKISTKAWAIAIEKACGLPDKIPVLAATIAKSKNIYANAAEASGYISGAVAETLGDMAAITILTVEAAYTLTAETYGNVSSGIVSTGKYLSEQIPGVAAAIETLSNATAKVAETKRSLSKAAQRIFPRLAREIPMTTAQLQPLIELRRQFDVCIIGNDFSDGQFFSSVDQLAENPRFAADALSLLLLATIRRSGATDQQRDVAYQKALSILNGISDAQRRIRTICHAWSNAYAQLGRLKDLDLGVPRVSLTFGGTTPAEIVTSHIEQLLVDDFDRTLRTIPSAKVRAKILLVAASPISERQFPAGFSIHPFNEVYYQWILNSVDGMDKKDHPEILYRNAVNGLHHISPGKYPHHIQSARPTVLTPVQVKTVTPAV